MPDIITPPPATVPPVQPVIPTPVSAPTVPPPATPPTPPVVPPPQPPLPPKPEPEHHNPSRLAPLLGIFVLILAAIALLFLKNPFIALFSPSAPVAPPPVVVPTPTPVVTPPAPEEQAPSSTVPTTGAATTTPEATSTPAVTTPAHTLGETVQFFLNDDITFNDAKNPKRSFTVTAVEFTDSRCPKGVVCVWQGELGVRLRVVDRRTGQSEDVSLGTVRTKTATALGLRFTLREIDEGKGGTYASVTVQ